MTKEELRQLYYLQKEIKIQKQQISELETAAACTAKLTGMPKTKEMSDKVGRYAVQIADLQRRLETNLQEHIDEFSRLTGFIENITDSEMRVIFTLRYAQGMTWREIAKKLKTIGDGSTERKKNNAFLKKIQKF